MRETIKYKVCSENYEEMTVCETLEEAEALRYQKYGYAGHIIDINEKGDEVAVRG